MSDETMSVLPRILDPSMKFTVNSIKQMPSKEEVNSKDSNLSKKENREINHTDSSTTKPIEENVSSIYLFFSSYKYVILTIIIIILTHFHFFLFILFYISITKIFK